MDLEKLKKHPNCFYSTNNGVLLLGDCLEILPHLEPVDLVLTSPPYDSLRQYNGYHFNFNETAKWIKSILVDGGVCVWVVGDETINGNETGTSFKQALFFKYIGMNLHDTMIYAKGGQGATGSNLSYWQDFEYMFVFVNGKIKTFNPIKDRLNKTNPRTATESQGHRYENGETKQRRNIKRSRYGKRFNIWEIHENGTRCEHPAVFPFRLAADHITSWSNNKDLVLDPFIGSGTTAIACERLNRRWIGIEISEEYCSIAKKRIEKELKQLRLPGC